MGCATAPKSMQKQTEGYWAARALVRDRDQGLSYIVNLSFNAARSKGMRMDVTDTLNTPVASMVYKGDQVQYIIFRSKKYFYGASQPNVMRPILAVPFNPKWVSNILFDEPVDDKSWSCTQDKHGIVSDCKDKVSGLAIKWGGRSGSRKTVEIQHSRAEVQINFKEFKPKVENRKNLFEVEAPEGFQKLRVR